MILARGITKSYGSLEVLKGIDLFVKEGEIVSIVGASGAGKSTLLHILGTLDTPDLGTLTYDDVPVFSLTPNEISRFRNLKVGFVFQGHQLLPEFSALENIAMPAWIAGQRASDTDKRARELLSLMGLSSRADHRPSELSGGEQQRVAVARAMINSPRVILADEPSGNLDTETKKELHRLFFTLRREMGQTFVIVTHDMELAEMSDRQIRLQDGRIIGETYNPRT